MDSPVRLAVSPTTVTPTDFYSQRFWGFLFLHWNPSLPGLSCSPVYPHANVGPPGPLATAMPCVLSDLAVGCLSTPILPIWMNVSLTPWLLDSHTVQLSGSSGYFWLLLLLFLSWLLSFFLLCKKPTPPSWLERHLHFLNAHWVLAGLLLNDCVNYSSLHGTSSQGPTGGHSVWSTASWCGTIFVWRRGKYFISFLIKGRRLSDFLAATSQVMHGRKYSKCWKKGTSYTEYNTQQGYYSELKVR